MSPFKSAGASVQSTTGSQGVRISGSNAGYTMFRGSVKGTGYPLHSPVSPSLPLPSVTVCHHVSTGLYLQCSSYSAILYWIAAKTWRLMGKELLYWQSNLCLFILPTYVRNIRCDQHLVKCNVLLTVHLSTTLVNNQLDVKLLYFIIRLLQSSTCFEQRRAHHQDVKLY